MNQKMASKKNKKDRKKKSSYTKPVGLPEVEEEQEEVVTYGDRILNAVSPYISTIAFALVAGFLGFAIIAFLLRSSADKKAMEWRELNNATNIALRSGDISGWKQVADAYPDTKAGLWANQMAGDQQLRMGLEQLTYNKESGKGMIEKAKEYFQTVVDAPDTSKTPMLNQSSHFALAYAKESLGEFEEAKTIYEKLLEEAPDSAFASHAQRGLARTGNSDYAEMYSKFDNWQEEEVGDAPGVKVPSRPSIGFPEIGETPPVEKSPTVGGGGNFGSGEAVETPDKTDTKDETKGEDSGVSKTDESSNTPAAGSGTLNSSESKSSESGGDKKPDSSKTGEGDK